MNAKTPLRDKKPLFTTFFADVVNTRILEKRIANGRQEGKKTLIRYDSHKKIS